VPGTKIDPSKPKLGLRTDQFNYVQMILLASVVGMLAALGNLGFRALIHFSDALFRGLEWNALGINLGGVHLALIPLILASGAAGMLLLDRFFRGDVLGYGFPHFLEQVNLGNARIKRGWIFVKAAGAALSLGSGWSVGRKVLSRKSAAPSAQRSRNSANSDRSARRCWSRPAPARASPPLSMRRWAA